MNNSDKNTNNDIHSIVSCNLLSIIFIHRVDGIVEAIANPWRLITANTQHNVNMV